MGARIFSTFIKIENPQSYDIQNISQILFNSSEYQLNKKSGRHSKNVSMSICKEGIHFSYCLLMSEILFKNDHSRIKQFYDFFDKPEYIVSYMINDFNNGAGFAIIKDGYLKRVKYFNPDYVKYDCVDYGDPLLVEREHLEKYEYEKKETMEILGIKDGANFHYMGSGLVEKIVSELLGFSADSGPVFLITHQIVIDNAD